MDKKLIWKMAAKRKASKKDAYATVCNLIEGMKLTEPDLAALYSYFMPVAPAVCKTPEQWVARAMGDRDVRAYLNYVYSDGERIVATDGHRMHSWKTDKYPAGYYDKMMNPVDVEYKYPDVGRVIPKRCRQDRRSEFEIGDLEVVDLGNDNPKAYRLVYRLKDSDKTGWQVPYIRDALNRGLVLHRLNERGDGTGAMLIDGPFDDCLAVVMPCSLS